MGKRSAQRRAVQRTQRTASTSANRESASRETVQPEKKNLGQRVGETAGKIADTPSRVRDKAAETVQKVKDAPTNAEYAVRSNVESARESVRGNHAETPRSASHRWNLAGLPPQAAVSSYLSEKENAMSGNPAEAQNGKHSCCTKGAPNCPQTAENRTGKADKHTCARNRPRPERPIERRNCPDKNSMNRKSRHAPQE